MATVPESRYSRYVEVIKSDDGNDYGIYDYEARRAIESISEGDTKVMQSNLPTSNADYRVLLSAHANDTTETDGVWKNEAFIYNPTGRILTIGDPNANHTSIDPTTISMFNSNEGSGGSIISKGTIDNWNAATTWVTNNGTAALSDVNVQQINQTNSAYYRVLLSGNASDNTYTGTAGKSYNLRFNPSVSKLYVGPVSSGTYSTVSFDEIEVANSNLTASSRMVPGGITPADWGSYQSPKLISPNGQSILGTDVAGILIGNDGALVSSGNYFTHVWQQGIACSYNADGIPWDGADANTSRISVTGTNITLRMSGASNTITKAKVDTWDDHTENGNYNLTAATTQAVYPIKIDNRGHISAHGTAVTIPTASTTAPLMDGTASYGSGTVYARSNHVHPSDTSRASKDDFQRFTVSGTSANPDTNTQTLTSGHIYLLVVKRMNNTSNGGIYIVAPHTTTGSVTTISAASGATVTISSRTLTVRSTVANNYCRLIDLNMQS